MTEVQPLHFNLAGSSKEFFLVANMPDDDVEADHVVESLNALNRLHILEKILGCPTCPARRPENRPVQSAKEKRLAVDDELVVKDRGWEDDDNGGHNRVSIHCLPLFQLASTTNMASCADGVSILSLSDLPTEPAQPGIIEPSPSMFLHSSE